MRGLCSQNPHKSPFVMTFTENHPVLIYIHILFTFCIQDTEKHKIKHKKNGNTIGYLEIRIQYDIMRQATAYSSLLLCVSKQLICRHNKQAFIKYTFFSFFLYIFCVFCDMQRCWRLHAVAILIQWAHNLEFYATNTYTHIARVFFAL